MRHSSFLVQSTHPATLFAFFTIVSMWLATWPFQLDEHRDTSPLGWPQSFVPVLSWGMWILWCPVVHIWMLKFIHINWKPCLNMPICEQCLSHLIYIIRRGYFHANAVYHQQRMRGLHGEHLCLYPSRGPRIRECPGMYSVELRLLLNISLKMPHQWLLYGSWMSENC